MFCPKCKAMLIPRKEGNKIVVKCSCGYVGKDGAETKLKEKVDNKKDDISVVESEFEVRPSDRNAQCEKCGHKGALFRTQQTRSADESETRFYECEKCHHKWRDYS